jgi:hypothetical protein
MTSLPFLFETVLISLPGVMSPGPIIAVAIGEGKKLPHVGACQRKGNGVSLLFQSQQERDMPNRRFRKQLSMSICNIQSLGRF